eukprot:TRINITY_DN214_c1_g1_i1.p1 TRINITY_DN214_c1_g1~~TRINITY_DN214_c1_g1_i1.p1  ORF type:complete len:3655 (-),score=926.48 TRINITY_DN214_c1_g1_i1:96-9494(-)
MKPDFSEIVNVKLRCCLKTSSIEFVHAHLRHSLLFLECRNLVFQFISFTGADSVILDMDLHSVEIFDRWTQGTRFPRLLFPTTGKRLCVVQQPLLQPVFSLPQPQLYTQAQQTEALPPASEQAQVAPQLESQPVPPELQTQIQEQPPDSEKAQATSEPVSRPAETPTETKTQSQTQTTFYMKFEYKPLCNKAVDYSIFVDSQPMTLIYNAPILERIVNFMSVSGPAWKRIEELNEQARVLVRMGLSSEKQLGLEFNFKAPVIIIPEDFAADDTAVAVIDLGKLTVKKEKPDIFEALSFQRINTQDDDLYHLFAISVQSAYVLLGTFSDGAWCSDKEEDLQRIRLVDQFDMQFYLQMCNIISADIPKFKIHGNLPDFALKGISPMKYKQILHIFQVFTRVNSNKLEQEVQIEKKAAGEVTFENTMVFHFCVSALSAHIKPVETDPDLAIMKFSGFSLSMIKEATLFKAEVKVLRLDVADLLYESHLSAPLQLLESDEPPPSGATDQEEEQPKQEQEHPHLLSIQYLVVPKDSPLFKADQEVQVDFSRVRLNCYSNTVAAVMELVDQIFSSPHDDDNGVARKDASEKEASDSCAVQGDGSSPKYLVTLNLNVLQFALILRHGPIAAFHLNNFSLVFLQRAASYSLKGCMWSIVAQDLTPQGKVYGHVCDIQSPDKAMVRFEYAQQGPSSKLEVHMTGARVVYLSRFQEELGVFRDSVRAHIRSDTAEKAAQYARDAVANMSSSTEKQMRYLWIADDMYVVMPASSASPRMLAFDLGHIVVHNTFESDPQDPLVLETINFKLDHVKGWSGTWDGSLALPSAEKPRMLSEIDLQLGITMPLSRHDLPDHVPLHNITLAASPLNITFNEQQYAVLLDIYEINFTEHPSHGSGVALAAASDSTTRVAAAAASAAEAAPRGTSAVNTEISAQVAKLSLTVCECGDLDSGAAQPFVQFLIPDFALKSASVEDTSMIIDIQCSAFTVVDKRADANNSHSFILGPTKDMQDKVFAKYSRLPDGNQVFDTTIPNPKGIIFLPVLVPIKDFVKQFWDDLRAMLARRNAGQSLAPPQRALPAGRNSSAPTTATSSELSEAGDDGAAAATTTQLKIKMTNPILFFLEDAADDNSRSVVLTASLDVDFTSRNNEDSWGICMVNTQLYITNMQSQDTSVSIVEPFDTKLDYVWTPKKVSFSTQINPLNIMFSYQDFKFSMSVFNKNTSYESKSAAAVPASPPAELQWSSSAASLPSDEEHALPPSPLQLEAPIVAATATEQADLTSPECASAAAVEASPAEPGLRHSGYMLYSEYIKTMLPDPPTDRPSGEDSETCSTTTQQSEMTEPGDLEFVPEEESSVKSSACVACGGLNFTVIDDCTTDITPLLNVDLYHFNLDWASTAATWTLGLSSYIRTEYFNASNAGWEPLVEPWVFQLQCKKSHKGAIKLHLFSPEHQLSLNLTRAFMNTCLETYSVWLADFSQDPLAHKSDGAAATATPQASPVALSPLVERKTAEGGSDGGSLSDRKRSMMHMYYLRNDTDEILWYWNFNNTSIESLAAGEEKSIVVTENSLRKKAEVVSSIISTDYRPFISIWEQDSATLRCRKCHREFSILWRRHHCRGCGKIFCADCTSLKGELDGQLVRLCADCFELQKKMKDKAKSDASAKVPASEDSVKDWMCSSCGHVNLPGMDACVICHVSQNCSKEEADLGAPKKRRTISFQKIGDFGPFLNCPIDRIGTYTIHTSHENDSVKVVYEVTHRKGNKAVSIRSNIIIENCSTVPIEVLLNHAGTSDHETIPAIQPGNSSPIPINYASDCCMYFRPSSEFNWSNVKIDCRFLKQISRNQKESVLVPCKRKANAGLDWYFQCCVYRESGIDSGGRHLSPHDFRLSFSPPITLDNLLSVNLSWRLQTTTHLIAEGFLKQGEKEPVYFYQKGLFLSFQFSCFDWTVPFMVQKESKPGEKLESFEVDAVDPKKQILSLRVEQSLLHSGALNFIVYCPFWLVNKTGLPMLFRSKTLLDSQILNSREDKFLAAGLFVTVDATAPKPVSDGTPFMFSPKSEVLAYKLEAKVGTSAWSTGMALNKQNSVELLDLEDNKKSLSDETALFSMGISFEPGPDHFWRTKVVTFCPGYILINDSRWDLCIRQKGAMSVQPLLHGEKVAYHWADAKLEKRLIVTIPQEGHHWSGSILVSKMGSFTVKIRTAEVTYMINVSIKMRGASTMLCFTEACQFSPYQICNLTKYTIAVHQDVGVAVQGVDFVEILQLPPGESHPFTWDELSQAPRLAVHVLPDNVSGSYAIDILGKHMPHLKTQTDVLCVDVTTDGPTKVVCISCKGAKQGSQSVTAMPRHGHLQYVFVFDIPGLGISFVDHIPQELMFVSLLGLHASWAVSSVDVNFRLAIHCVQIDNQLYRTPFPVLLRPSEGSALPFLDIEVVKWRVPGAGEGAGTAAAAAVVDEERKMSVELFREVTVRVQEFDLNVDGQFLMNLIAAINVNSDIIQKRPSFEEVTGFISNANAVDSQYQYRYHLGEGETQQLYTKMVYVEELRLYPLHATVSFQSVARQSNEPQPAAVSPNIAINETIASLLALPTTVMRFDKAAISFDALFVQHLFHSKDELIDRVCKHYKQQALNQLYKVFGSFDVIGSPVSLVDNLGIGFHDLFAKPAQGYEKGEFGAGLARGTKSMVDHTIYGFSNTIDKLCASAAKGLVTISSDSDWITDSEEPKHVAHGAMLGAISLGKGIVKGVTGIVEQPVKGAMQNGFLGCIKGVGKGIIGVPLNPAAGIFALVSKTSGGVRSSTTASFRFVGTRRRLPRYFPRDGSLEGYNLEKAQGRATLEELEHGRYASGLTGTSEVYLFHVQLVNKQVLLASTEHIFLLLREPFCYEKIWSLPLSRLTGRVDLQDQVLFIFFKRKTPLSGVASEKAQCATAAEAHALRAQLLQLLAEALVEPPPELRARAMTESPPPADSAQSQQISRPSAEYRRSVYGGVIPAPSPKEEEQEQEQEQHEEQQEVPATATDEKTEEAAPAAVVATAAATPSATRPAVARRGSLWRLFSRGASAPPPPIAPVAIATTAAAADSTSPTAEAPVNTPPPPAMSAPVAVPTASPAATAESAPEPYTMRRSVFNIVTTPKPVAPIAAENALSSPPPV